MALVGVERRRVRTGRRVEVALELGVGQVDHLGAAVGLTRRRRRVDTSGGVLDDRILTGDTGILGQRVRLGSRRAVRPLGVGGGQGRGTRPTVLGLTPLDESALSGHVAERLGPEHVVVEALRVTRVGRVRLGRDLDLGDHDGLAAADLDVRDGGRLTAVVLEVVVVEAAVRHAVEVEGVGTGATLHHDRLDNDATLENVEGTTGSSTRDRDDVAAALCHIGTTVEVVLRQLRRARRARLVAAAAAGDRRSGRNGHSHGSSRSNGKHRANEALEAITPRERVDVTTVTGVVLGHVVLPLILGGPPRGVKGSNDANC